MEVQSSHLKIPAFTYRFLGDDHLQKFISKNKGLRNPLYEPTDLVPLQSSQFLSIQGNRSLRTQANEHLIQLSQAFYEQFQKPIVVISAYRSYTYQKYQISESCKQSGYCAKEGESEHQLGLAVDLREATNEEKFLLNYQNYYDWLKDHAHVYGFHQSYQHGKDSDGYAIEPRHWRYLGVDLATILYKKNITFAEYVGYNTVQKK
jgi:D-alanyl-D-alanine carboxypeptidase